MKTLDQMTLDELKAWEPAPADLIVIQEMALKIARAFRPAKIVLFGSHAREDATEQSDVDLLVIMDSSEPPPRRSVPIYRLLRNYMIPVDILVRTPEEAKECRGLLFSVIQTALQEGVTLYEREA